MTDAVDIERATQIGKEKVSAPPCVIVAGMHRSGTSLIGQALFRAGVNMGQRQKAPSRFNVFGYCEDEDFLAFHEVILHANMTNWRKHPRYASLNISKAMEARAAQLINAKAEAGKPWGWKDPRTLLFLPLWQRLVPNAYWVCPYRDPATRARSLPA